MFDILARHGEFFAVRQSQPVDLFVLVLVLCFVLPLPLVAVSGVAGWFGSRKGMVIQAALVGLLTAMVPAPPLVRAGALGAPEIIVACLLAGVLAAVLYARLIVLRQLLSYIGVGFLCLPALFLLDPAIRKSAFPVSVTEEARAAISSDTPVVLLVLDEFPTSSILGAHGEIDKELFPNFANLAREAIWFRNATTVATNTHMAIPSILTGNNPEPGLYPTRQDHPQNLLTLLQGIYRTDALEPYTQLQIPDPADLPTLRQRLASLFNDLRVVYLHVFLPSRWSGGLPPISQGWKNFAAGEPHRDKQRAKRLKGGNAQIRRMHVGARELFHFAERIDSSPSSLWFMHSLLPHAPHNIYPSGRYYSRGGIQPSGEGAQAGLWSGDKWAVSQAYQRHLLQVSLVDKMIGHLIGRLKEVGLWDTAVIIVTADHGISFREGDSRRSVSNTNFADILAVPLFVRAPGLEVGRFDDNLVRTTDILPTIAHLLDISLPWPVDGLSLFDPSITTRTMTFSIDGDETRAFARDAIERVRAEAVAAKLAMFDSEHPGDLYKLGQFGRLVGRRVDSLPRLTEAGLRGRIDEPGRYQDVSLRRGELPGLVVGRVELGPDDQLPWIALAVNGIVRSVTRPYERYRDQQEVLWAATISESSIVGGRNVIEMFALDISPDGQVSLRPVEAYEASSDFREVTLGATQVWGVRESGFHEAGPTKKPHRWTNGAALLAVPVDADDPPVEIEVKLLGWGPKETSNLRIVVNDVELYAGPAPGKTWSRTFPLDAVEPAAILEIEILSETWGPDNNRGVLVRKIMLH